MAKEYIEREVALKNIKETIIGASEFANDIRNSAINAVNSAPTADVREVRHGKWVKRDVFGEDPIECDCCGNSVSVYGYDYCPNCGAKMDLE